MNAVPNLPDAIRAILGGAPYTTDHIGMSDAQVRLYPDKVLKILPDNGESAREVDVLRWLAGRLPVPRVLACERQEGRLWLLMTRLTGRMTCDESMLSDPAALTGILAEGLRMLWAVPTGECPIRCDLDAKLRIARDNVEQGLVSVDNVEPETFGPGGFRDPEHLLYWLESNRPPEELAFTHGDFCLPNIFFENGHVSGFLDLGKAGLADPYQDLAIGVRSLRHNTDGTYGPRIDFDPMALFDRLGLRPDTEKLRYYTLLDELF